MSSPPKRYPFKFLDAYTQADSEFFFGREEEIEALYKMVFQTDLLLIYGASGTGKTSLIQCGLASKFQSHDWLALNVRRGSNLNESLQTAIIHAGGSFEEDDDLAWLNEDLSSDDPGETTAVALSLMAKSLKAVYLQHFKPIYLIFDQFEELYVLGNREEQDLFIETVKEILRVEQPVKIILSIREEYLGYLYEFERKVPELLRKKLRVEPMNLDKIRTVLVGVAVNPQSNIHLQKGKSSQIAEAVFEKIKGKEKTLSIPLPYLQVFLDKLYMQETQDEERVQEASFTLAAIEQMGDIDDVLRDFLDEQVLKIAQAQRQKPELLWKCLSPFVTYDGTKEPISLSALQQRLPEIQAQQLKNYIQQFVKSRILRFNEQSLLYEVAHDTLAKQIHAKRSDEDIAILEVERLIKTQLALPQESRELFSEKQLQFVEPYLDKLNLGKTEFDFLQASQKEVDQLRRQKNRRRQITILSVATAFLIMAALTWWALQQQQEAQKALDAVNRSQKIRIAEELKGYGDRYWDIDKKADATEMYQAALDTLKDYPDTELYDELLHKIKLSQ